MNQVEETVLIPKDQYESLIQAASNEAKQTDMTFTEDANSVQAGGLSDNSKDLMVTKETSQNIKDPPANTNDSDASFEALKSRQVKPEDTLVVNNNVPFGNDNHQDDALNGQPTASAMGNVNQEEQHVSTDGQLLNMSSSERINLLLDKVPSKLKEPVKLLAAYIAENGKGIISWDRKLRFILFHAVIPRTNFAKLITYVLQKSEKRPKGTTIFGKALQSIGMPNPAAWTFSQVKNAASPDKNHVGANVQPDKNHVGDNVDSGSEKPKLGKQNHKKLKQLQAKWALW